jgi:SAM-dependent methyltransferase
MDRIENLLAEQIAYYRARASEYDEWWLRQGRYNCGSELNAAWFSEAEEVVAALEAFKPGGRILELACGTGLWTERLVTLATELTALDASPEVLALNAARLRSNRVRYINADLFQWCPPGRFEMVFFSFWLSHVPPDRFAAFWELVGTCLVPGGRVFFVDSRRESHAAALDTPFPSQSPTTMRRRLNDGQEFEIFKIYYDVDQLTEQLRTLGWQFEVRQTRRYFLHGAGNRLA